MQRRQGYAVRLATGLASIFLLATAAKAQVGLTPWGNIQFTDQNGRPLSGGKVYTCQAGASCPGTPLATYTTSSGSTPHANPITLDSSGRPPGGQIWLTSSVAYKYVVANALGAIIAGAGGDNLTSGGGGGGGGGSNQWTTSGNDIYNNNSGKVSIGTNAALEKLTVLGTVDFQGELKIRNSDVTSHSVSFISPPGLVSDFRYTLPSAFPASTSCFQSSNAGIISFVTCSGGGGGGGAANYTQTFSAVTSATLAHNLNSTGVLATCYDDSSPEKTIALTADYPKVVDANNVSVAWTGSKSGHCVVNSSAGNPNLFSKDGYGNITVTDSATSLGGTFSAPTTFWDQTPATGQTAAMFIIGAGQAGANVVRFRDGTGANDVGGINVNTSLSSAVQFPIFAAGLDANSVGTAALFYNGGLFLGNTTGVRFSSDATWFGAQDTCIFRISAGLLQLGDCLGSDRDLQLRNLTVSGTCTGCGGGGSTLPVLDSIPIAKGSSDATKQVRFEVDSLSPSTIAVLTITKSLTPAGVDVLNTFSLDQTFQGQHIFQQGGLTRFTIGTGAGGGSLDFSRYDNSGTLVNIPMSIDRASGNINVSNSILANGAVNIGSFSSPFSSGTFTGVTLTNSVTFNNGAGSIWRLGFNSGNLAISDLFGSPMMISQATPHLFSWYADMLPDITVTRDLGASSLRWDKLWVRDIDFSGTCSGCSGGGANTSLSNLSAVNINQSLTTGSDATISVGTSAVRFNTFEGVQFIARTSASSNRRCRMSGGDISCYDGGGVQTFSASSITGAVVASAYSSSGGAGATGTVTVKGSTGANCGITVSGGIFISTTCP